VSFSRDYAIPPQAPESYASLAAEAMGDHLDHGDDDMPAPTHSTRRQYYEMQADSRKLHAEAMSLIAQSHDIEAIMARCDWHLDEAGRASATAHHQRLAASYHQRAADWEQMAKDAAALAEKAKGDEIREDYYSGPPGSFTGD
jgi:hypothetical protein